MEITDNGPVEYTIYLVGGCGTKVQAASSHTGLGVQNIIERLNVLYSDKHNFKVTRGLTAGYRMQISIPEEYL